MKDSDIHIGLDKKDIRDFLGAKITECYRYRTDTDAIEAEIEALQVQLQQAKEKQAIHLLRKMCGWLEFDVSELRGMEHSGVAGDYIMLFVGTLKEFQAFLTQYGIQEDQRERYFN